VREHPLHVADGRHVPAGDVLVEDERGYVPVERNRVLEGNTDVQEVRCVPAVQVLVEEVALSKEGVD